MLGYVVGIGVNIGKPDFPEEIADIAGALSGGTQLKFKLFEEIRVNFFASLNEAPQKLISYCTEKSYVIGKKIRYFGAADGFGTAAGLAENGGLIVDGDGGERIILTGGEISVRME